MNNDIIPPRVPFVDTRTGNIDRAWYLFLLSLRTNSDANLANIGDLDALGATARAPGDYAALAREVAELRALVATLKPPIDSEAVTKTATQTLSNKTLAAPTLTGTTTAGAINASGNVNATGFEVRGTSLRIDTAPIAGALLATHKVAVNVNGSPYFILLST